MSQAAYRLFVERGGRPHTLYHAHKNGSKRLALGEWMPAVQRVGANPGKLTKSIKKFRTGWHVFPTVDDLIKYCRKMHADYRVCRVWVTDVRSKPRSRSTVLLAKNMVIPNGAWADRVPLGKLLEGE